MSIHRRFSINPQRRERLVNLAEFNRAAAAPETMPPSIEVMIEHVQEGLESPAPVDVEPAE